VCFAPYLRLALLRWVGGIPMNSFFYDWSSEAVKVITPSKTRRITGTSWE